MSSACQTIYLDHNATSRALPVVRAAVSAEFAGPAGNPDSRDHACGRAARATVEAAAQAVRGLFSADGSELVWTSGATESCNLGILGTLGSRPPRHVVSQTTEHPAVLACVRAATRAGHRATLVDPDRAGRVDPDAIAAALEADTRVVSIMLANNETGVLQPIPEIADRCRARGVLLHVDATQACGRTPVDLGRIDLLSGSCHKSGGPPGLGFLLIAGRTPPVRLQPGIHGGGQQRGLRSGTLNVPAIAGGGAWASWWTTRVEDEARRLAGLRDRLWHLLSTALPDAVLFGAAAPRLPNTLCIGFDGIDATCLLERLSGIAASSGSACASALPQPSHVLRAMAVAEPALSGAVRLSLGWSTTPDEVEQAGPRIIDGVRRLRGC